MRFATLVRDYLQIGMVDACCIAQNSPCEYATGKVSLALYWVFQTGRPGVLAR
jgi:hypothetical protein